MTRADRRLLQHLTLAVLVKLVLLTVLWALFVRDARVKVDPDLAARRLVLSQPSAETSLKAEPRR
jgi:hypothetical protein